MKKNIRPQQVAPVQRDTKASTGSTQQGGMVPLLIADPYVPFAGDDAQ